MATKKEMNDKFFTEEGLKSLEKRAKTLCRLFNENNFPINNMMLGFGPLKIDNRGECLARILEISDLVGFQAKIVEIENKDMRIEY